MIEKILAENGLTAKESAIYLAALESGEATMSGLANKTHLKRTTVYDVVASLADRGILSVTKRKGIQYVSALAPRSLIERFKNAAKDAEGLLPHLLELSYSSPLKPKMRFYEGIEGLKEILRDMSFSNSGQTIGFSDYTKMPKELFQFIQKEVVPRRKEHKNFVRLICPRKETNLKIQKDDALHFREHRIVDLPDPETMDLEILLYSHTKVGFLCYEDEGDFGIVIDSPSVFKMLSSAFWIIWNIAEKAK